METGIVGIVPIFPPFLSSFQQPVAHYLKPYLGSKLTEHRHVLSTNNKPDSTGILPEVNDAEPTATDSSGANKKQLKFHK